MKYDDSVWKFELTRKSSESVSMMHIPDEIKILIYLSGAKLADVKKMVSKPVTANAFRHEFAMKAFKS